MNKQLQQEIEKIVIAFFISFKRISFNFEGEDYIGFKGKDEGLLRDRLTYLLEHYISSLQEQEDTTPIEKLTGLLDTRDIKINELVDTVNSLLSKQKNAK